MKLTKRQQGQYERFCKKHDIVGFGGIKSDKPCISLEIFPIKRAKKEVWITRRCITGHNIGIHRSVEGDAEVIAGWCGYGWCLFGRRFVEQLTKEFCEIFPEFVGWTKGYEDFDYKQNYVQVFPSINDCLKAEIELSTGGTEV